MKNDQPDLPETDAIILAGLSPPVMSLAAWLAHEKYRLRHLHKGIETVDILHG